MAFNKIQPEQIQLHTFFSDSGDIRFTQSATGVKTNLSRDLTGNFSFTGDLLTNGKSVFGLANTGDNHFETLSGNLLFQGSNTDLGASVDDGDNVAIIANNCDVSGKGNLLLNAENIDFVGFSNKNTALGKNISFGSDITGSFAMKDMESPSFSVDLNHSLFVNFASGHHFRGGENYFDNAASFNDSGIFSGNLEVLSDAILSGSTIVNESMLNANRRKVTGTLIFETGFQLPIWQGNSSTAGTTANPATGALAISGRTLCVFVGGSWAGVNISGAGI
tara:strand:- start:118 stop:951 length:834 start_codon:yes stop_codon:yes gene_type:complete